MKVVQSIARGKKIICQTGLVHQPVCRIIIFTTMTCIVLFLRSFNRVPQHLMNYFLPMNDLLGFLTLYFEFNISLYVLSDNVLELILK